MSGKCCVVADRSCEAPANGPGTVRTQCFACGQPVCRPCSVVRAWSRYPRRKRICLTCHEDEVRTRAAETTRERAVAAKRQLWEAQGRRSDFCAKGQHGWCANRDFTESHCQCPCHRTRPRRCPTCGGTGQIRSPARLPR